MSEWEIFFRCKDCEKKYPHSELNRQGLCKYCAAKRMKYLCELKAKKRRLQR